MRSTPPNPLTVLRLALPGQPSSSDLARQLGCSKQLLHKWERGEGEMSEALIAKYAKLVRAEPSEIRARWIRAALETNRRHRSELLDELKQLTGSRPLKRGRKSA